jgi:E3 ubiquitin-protein ligase BRE1
MDEQRESTKLKRLLKKDSKATSSVSTSGNGAAASTRMTEEDADMLELTLSMLRCSVCKDRFKSVAITRCFHLFCKECIDENLRNRSRKCPACGEKFGQDDVANIYFTN